MSPWYTLVPAGLPTLRLSLYGPDVVAATEGFDWRPLESVTFDDETLWCDPRSAPNVRARRNHYGLWAGVTVRPGEVRVELNDDPARSDASHETLERLVRHLAARDAVTRWIAWSYYQDSGECTPPREGDGASLRSLVG